MTFADFCSASSSLDHSSAMSQVFNFRCKMTKVLLDALTKEEKAVLIRERGSCETIELVDDFVDFSG